MTTALKENAMKKNIKEKLEYLRIWGLAENWDSYLEEGNKKDMSHVQFLEYFVSQTYMAKTAKAKYCRHSRAKIPERHLIETFPFERQPNLNKRKVMNIYDTLDYMTKKQNLILVGPTGSGKSGLGTAFLIHAIDEGFNGHFVGFAELLDKFHKAAADRSEDKILKRYAGFDCLLIDEIGYADVDSARVGWFFRLMHQRYRSKTTIVTSNLGFQHWGSFLKNDHLTAALVDRLTENAHVINMRKCISLRPKPTNI